MLVSYQVTGGRLNNDNACISLVEFDVRTNEIKPNNFIIITQKKNKDYVAQESQ